MAFKIIKKLMTKNICYTNGKKIIVKGVMVHSDACKAGLKASAWYSRWNKKGLEKCVHFFVDNTEAYQYLPAEKGDCSRAYHCGSDINGSFNSDHVAFEMSEPKDYTDKVYFDAIYDNAVELTVKILKEHGVKEVNEETVLCHSEGYTKFKKASNHGDVMHWFKFHRKTMDDFRADVKKLLNSGNTTSKKYVTVATKKDNLICRKSASAIGKNIGQFEKGSKLELIEKTNEKCYKVKGLATNGKVIAGYVSAKYLG